jgi:hypothetical protein
MDTSCVHYSRDYVGSPCIVAQDPELCVVGDATGHLTVINLTTQAILSRAYVGAEGGHASSNLRSLRAGPRGSKTVAVATRGGYAAIVHFGRQVVEKVYPQQGGSVNAVAISPDGQLVAIGTGHYSLSGDPPPARIEIWNLPLFGAPQYRTFAALPGVCIDAIAWSRDGYLIACAAGLRSQKGGTIAQFDAAQLRPVSFFDTPWCNSGRIDYLNRGASNSHLAVVFRGGFRVFEAWDGREAWRVDSTEVPDLIQDFDHDPDNQELALTSGVILDAFDGSQKKHFLAMKDCTSIAIRPGGGYLGASNRGRVYCWD